MNIQVNTDKNITGTETLVGFVRDQIQNSLSNFNDKITRVEVHLGDENSHKEGSRDKRCMIEARLERLQPIAVTEQADTIEQAVAGAAGKIKRAIQNSIGKLGK
jgi:hypothetical protein